MSLFSRRSFKTVTVFCKFANKCNSNQPRWIESATSIGSFTRASTNSSRRLISSKEFTKIVVEQAISDVAASDFAFPEDVDLPHWIQTPVDYQIYKASNLDDLLTCVEKYRFTGSHCVSFLSRLCRFMPLNVEKLQQDVRFDCVCKTIKDEIHFMPPSQVLLALRSLIYLKVSEEKSSSSPFDELRKAVVHFVRVKRLAVSSLVTFACFHVDFVKNYSDGVVQERKDLQAIMEDAIADQLAEINDSNLILLILNKIRREPQWMRPVENRALDMVEIMTPEESTRLLNYVANAHSRNVPLLKAATKKICEDPSANLLSVKKLELLLMAVNRLNYYDPSLIERICKDLKIHVDTIVSDGVIQRLCTQIGNCRLRDEVLLRALIGWVERFSDFCKPYVFCSLLIMLARCNFEPKDESEVARLKKIRDAVKSPSNIANETSLFWLDYVWSLAVLKLLTAETAASVLIDTFWKSVCKEKSEFRNLITRLKILNVNTAAKLEMQSYPGMFVDEALYKSLPVNEHKISSHKSSVLRTFLEKLTFKTPSNFRYSDKISPEGYVIDAEIRVDASLAPLKTDQWTNDAKKELKIAFMIWGFFDKCVKDVNHLTGLNAMAVRHLQKLGYIVIQINDSEILRLIRKDPVQSATYFSELIERNIAASKKSES